MTGPYDHCDVHRYCRRDCTSLGSVLRIALARGLWLSITVSWVLLVVTTFGPDAIFIEPVTQP